MWTKWLMHYPVVYWVCMQTALGWQVLLTFAEQTLGTFSPCFIGCMVIFIKNNLSLFDCLHQINAFSVAVKVSYSTWRQLYVCACMHNYHRQWLKFHYPNLREERQEAENFFFAFFFSPHHPAKAGALRMAFKYREW